MVVSIGPAALSSQSVREDTQVHTQLTNCDKYQVRGM